MAEAMNGDSIAFFVNTGTDASPIYTEVGSARSFTLTREMDTIDATHKGSAGKNKEFLPGSKGGSISVSHLFVQNEAGISQLEESFENRTTLKVRYSIAGTQVKEASVYITRLSLEASNDTEAVFNCEALINGAVSDV